MQGENLSRALYAKPKPDFQLPPDNHLKRLDLYEIYQSRDSWFHNYNIFVLKDLLLQQTDGGRSFYYINKDALHGLLAFYDDGNIAAGSETLKTVADKIPKILEFNTWQYPKLLFAGTIVTKTATSSWNNITTPQISTPSQNAIIWWLQNDTKASLMDRKYILISGPMRYSYRYSILYKTNIT